ncbi:MAG TPA: type II toxin-antitoxin system RelE/ParE family toxin [Vicinamibacteria bacterium]|nr:type II toxin-antitoxin system RelE/ParE family toxin [Vicinamibacteria bacterium]
MVIQGFADKDTERVFRRDRSRRQSPNIQRLAQRKLMMLDAAESLQERVPPSNRLEKLKGDRGANTAFA